MCFMSSTVSWTSRWRVIQVVVKMPLNYIYKRALILSITWWLSPAFPTATENVRSGLVLAVVTRWPVIATAARQTIIFGPPHRPQYSFNFHSMLFHSKWLYLSVSEEDDEVCHRLRILRESSIAPVTRHRYLVLSQYKILTLNTE